MPLTVTIITPERALPPMQADHVTLPAFDGEVGIRPGHAAYVCQLGIGMLSVKSATQADTVYALKGGVAQVARNELKILAESVVEVTAISEQDLVRRLGLLNAAEYADPIELTKARAEALWLITQLKTAGKQIPDVSKLGL